MTAVPEGMTADKLRYIADYVQECDDIIYKYLVAAKAAGVDIKDEVFEFVTSKAVQQDLREWADSIEEERLEARCICPDDLIGSLGGCPVHNPEVEVDFDDEEPEETGDWTQ